MSTRFWVGGETESLRKERGYEKQPWRRTKGLRKKEEGGCEQGGGENCPKDQIDQWGVCPKKTAQEIAIKYEASNKSSKGGRRTKPFEGRGARGGGGGAGKIKSAD